MVKQTAAKRVLMIAFHYPPQRGSSGVQRTLKFSRYLGATGWNPLVLSAHPRAYANRGDDQLLEIPGDIVVRRAFALDSSRHLAIKGRYLGALALPDRWVSWLFGALPAGLAMVRRYRPQVIWSTYPIASAHLIGLLLHRLTGIPWVADLRDPMTDASYPNDKLVRGFYRWIEERTVRHSSRVVCTTPGAVAAYRARYPEIPAERFTLIENGYDEENFSAVDTAAASAALAVARGPVVLVHSGIIYPSERDPVPFFEALAALLREGRISAATLRVRLRAAVHTDYLEQLIASHGIGAIVTLEPHIAYGEALAEMLAADGLLVLQGSNCNCQIPAKLYEYLRARRPILALTDAAGDTAASLRQAGIDTIGPLDSREGIMAALMDFLGRLESGTAPLPGEDVVRANSRRARTGQLARVLDEVAAQPLGQVQRRQAPNCSKAP
jgi:glycosyltransferase involved in cell wall biosynthesis